MRITIIFLIIGYLLGCSGSGNPIATTYPKSILGEYNGTVSYTGYSGTLYPESDTTEIEFNFFDSTYYYILPEDFGSCRGGWGRLNYENGNLVLIDRTVRPPDCVVQPLNSLYGEFKVRGNDSILIIYQEDAENLIRTRFVLEFTRFI